MDHLSIQVQVSILMLWAPVLLCSVVEQEYIFKPDVATWDQARHNCKACYKDLVTLTPDNIQTIVRNLSSDYWVGLRKLNTTDCSRPWCLWANGDPLTFQNWYPGRPLAKPQEPPAPHVDKRETANMTNTTSPDMTSTVSPASTISPANLDRYIEFPCVAMLSFGAWFEMDCRTNLPYICYEERFDVSAMVTNVLSHSGTLRWLAGPSNVSRYRVEFKGGSSDFTELVNPTHLTYDLVNLTPGTRYSVQVFSIKCDRDLAPQKVTFYTKPEKVQNLRVTDVTENSVSLSWRRPEGNFSFYHVNVRGQFGHETKFTTDGGTVEGLKPGGFYTFDVITRITNQSTQGEPVSISTYTKPSKVSNLKASNNTNVSLHLRWTAGEGNTTGYRVTVLNSTKRATVMDSLPSPMFTKQTHLTVTGLPVGVKLWLSVVALANVSLEGTSVTIVSHTAPGPVTSLHVLATNASSMKATWVLPKGNYEYFSVELQLKGSDKTTYTNSTKTTLTLGSLMSGSHYRVTVRTVNGDLKSDPVVGSNFTLPVAPVSVSAHATSESSITLAWVPPNKTAAVLYFVTVSSPFWGHRWYQNVTGKTLTFDNLKSGTKYDFEVQLVAGNRKSMGIGTSNSTVAKLREITLSMLCSSTESLLCDRNSTKEAIQDKLFKYFQDKLKDGIKWEQVKQ